MSTSCSFRITRTAEDLAQTINALSQRLVKLEQRQEAVEMKVQQSQADPSPEDIERLNGVEQLLKECQELLESSSTEDGPSETWIEEQEHDSLAA